MILMYVTMLGLCLYGIRFNCSGLFEDCLEKEQCNTIKGVSIALVFISHIASYVGASGYAYEAFGDQAFQLIRSLLGQLIVVMFFFYSGYGIMESIENKGRKYIETMPRKRILTVLLNFDVAVCAFLCLNLLLGIKFSLHKVILSFLAWDSLGNSNWYIFVIIVCYSVSYLSFMTLGVVLGKKEYASWLALLGLICIQLGLTFVKESRWYNTMLAFPAGLLVSQYKWKVFEFLKRYYWRTLIVLFAVFVGLYVIGVEYRGITNNMLSVAFSLLVVLATMKVKIGNPVLCWLGTLVFPIYIYQRIPMIVLREFLGLSFICNHLSVYIICCLCFTMIIAWAYRFWKVNLK